MNAAQHELLLILCTFVFVAIHPAIRNPLAIHVRCHQRPAYTLMGACPECRPDCDELSVGGEQIRLSAVPSRPRYRRRFFHYSPDLVPFKVSPAPPKKRHGGELRGRFHRGNKCVSWYSALPVCFLAFPYDHFFLSFCSSLLVRSPVVIEHKIVSRFVVHRIGSNISVTRAYLQIITNV